MNATTAIAERQAPKPIVQSGGTISAMIPQNIDQAFRLARAIAGSGMAPKAYGQDENKCFVGILAGAEVGLAPFQALQSIAVIGGNPSLWGDGALGLVQASGLLADIEETDDGQKATCRMVRKGSPTAIVRTFSMDDAKKAGLAGKAGPWSQYPQRMRQMRARAWAMRDGFADVLKGLHIAEEVRDRPGMVDGGELNGKPQRLSSAMLAEQAGATVEHDADGVITDDQTVEHEPEGPADEQMGEAHSDATPAWVADEQRIRDLLDTAQTARDVKDAGTELDLVRVTIPDLQLEALDALVSKRRAQFQQKDA
ncbi:MAG: hypothetical protein ACK4ZW_08370 [Blastomonas sp.]